MFNVIRIPTKFSKTIKRMSNEERLEVFDLLIKIGDGCEISPPDNIVGDVVQLIYGEWMNMEAKNGVKREKSSINLCSGLPGEVVPSDPGTRVEYSRVEENRIEESREAGRLGGLAKASKSYQVLASASDAKHSLANLADNDNVNDNVNVNVTDTNKIGQENKQIQDTKPRKKSYDYSSLENDPEDSFAKEAYITLKKLGWNESIPLKEFFDYIDEFLVSKEISKEKGDFIKWKLGMKDFYIYWSNDKPTKKPNYLLKMRNSPSFNFNQKQYANR